MVGCGHVEVDAAAGWEEIGLWARGRGDGDCGGRGNHFGDLLGGGEKSEGFVLGGEEEVSELQDGMEKEAWMGF